MDFKNCKSGTISQGELTKERTSLPMAIFTVILTRQCNFRCTYCGIDFSDDVISYDTIDQFLLKISEYRKMFESVKLEFFGGEPLLEFEKIKYIVEKTSSFDIKYSVVTNGALFTQEIIDFFNENNFEVVFSVAFHTQKFLKENKELFENTLLDNFVINFIIEPGKEIPMYNVFISLVRLGFKNFVFLPVHYTVVWGKNDLLNLDLVLRKINVFYKKLKGIKNVYFSYLRLNKDVDFHVIKNDFELLLDYDGNVYSDYDSEFRLLNNFIKNEDIFSLNEIYLFNVKQQDVPFSKMLEKSSSINKLAIFNRIVALKGIHDNRDSLTYILKKNDINE